MIAAERSVFDRPLWAAAPAIAAFLVYASTLGAGYLYDDQTLIVTNRWVHDAGRLSQLPLRPLLASSGPGDTNYYRPVVSVLYSLTWRSLGGRPIAFHILNVLTHMLNATLLLKLVSRVTGAQGGVAVGAAVLFAVHPLNSEAVAWPSCLPELSYVAFGLTALLLHVAAWTAEERKARRLRFVACVLIGLACACKETALAFVPLIVLLELCFRPSRGSAIHRGIVAAVVRAVPYAVAAASYLAVRTVILGGIVPRGAHGLRTGLDAALNAPILLLRYARMMVFPWPLRIEHVVSLARSGADPRVLVGLAVVAAGALSAFRLRRSRPDLAFAAFATVIPLLPALYLPALGRDPFAERYAYLAVAGFCWLLVSGVEALTSSAARSVPAWIAPALLYAVTLAAAAATTRRCGDWFDDGTLGRAEIRAEPTAAIGYLLEGGWLERQGRLEEAWGVYQAGLGRVPSNTELQNDAIGLGVRLHHLTHDEVMAEYERLVPLSQDSAAAEFNLGHALLEGGRLDASRAAFARALEIAPRSVASMTALAEIAARQGDLATAAALCRRALAVDDRSTAALKILGAAAMRTGDVPGAITAYERAVLLGPDDKESLDRLGEAYVRADRIADARRVWERALRIDPGFFSARRNLDSLPATPR